jgi:predicted dehydrogenase
MSLEQPTERLNVGVVGLGYWGPNLLRVLTDDPGVEVKWICDLDQARLARFQRRYPSVTAASDVELLLNDDDLDALVIATPVFTHYDLCRRSLLAGKHTFVEKPLANTAHRAEDLVRTAAAEERVLMCGHTFVYSPAVRAVKRLIGDATLGEIFFISSSRVNLGLHQRDVSVIWDLGPHDFSILVHWLDETPTSVRAVGRDSIVSGIFDVAFVTLNFASGIVANVELSWLSPSKLRRTVVVGSEKMVVYDDGAAEPIRVFDHGVVYEDPQTFGEYHLSYRTGDIVSPKLESHEPLAAELSDFTTACSTGNLLPYHTGLAREVVRITEAADASLKLGGEQVEIAPTPMHPRFARRRQSQSTKEPALNESAVV